MGVLYTLLSGLLAAGTLCAQTTGATFGAVIRLGYTPADIVLDEPRQRLYLVNQNGNSLDVYSMEDRQVIARINVGSSPVAAALSMDGRFLYVSNNGNSTMSVIELPTYSFRQAVTLPAKPEGVEVGADGRVLITTEGTSTTDQVNSLLVYDGSQLTDRQLSSVPFAPPPPTPSPLPQTFIGRPQTVFRGKLQRTPDGRFIVGLSTINNNAQTVLFVYETASATILRSRTVTGQSTVLSMAPDGSRFMAGFTLYDTATLAVLAQQNASNVPFPLSSTGTATFSTLQNVGGSAFLPDNQTLLSAFNVAPFSQPAPRPQASTLLIGNSRNLGVRMGIKIPESIVAKMVMTADGSDAWGLSESGLLHLPLATLYDYPILMPETTAVFLAVDDCNRGLATASVRIQNLGKGKLTFAVPDTTAALVAQATSGVVPSVLNFTMETSRSNVTRQYGTNLYSGAATNTGSPLQVNLSSPEAINVPPTILVYMNNRQPDQRGVIHPVATVPTVSEGLRDILIDEARDRVYITNSGYNRIEVFDRKRQRFVEPVDVGQLPHQMALAGDGRTLYVANTGGESISIVDLDTGKVTGTVQFPPIPRAGNANPVTPAAIAHSLFGLQVIMSNGTQWKVVNNTAVTRPANQVTPTQLTTTGSPVRMIAAPGGRYLLAMAGNGTAYLYDGLVDNFTSSSRPYTAATLQGYFGPLAAGPDASYFLMNGFILNSSLVAIGGAETPNSTQSGLLASRRNIAAVAAIDENRFVRLTTPVKQAVNSTTTSDPRPVLELADFRDNSVTAVGAVAENPVFSVYGTSRVNMAPRQMAVDSNGTAYAITLSGLSVIPVLTSTAQPPRLATQANAVVNATDGSSALTPGSFVLVQGSNLAASAVSAQAPPSTVLGGVCVTLSDRQMPLIETSGGQILAQVPDDLPPGLYVLQVRSLALGQRSEPMVVRVERP